MGKYDPNTGELKLGVTGGLTLLPDGKLVYKVGGTTYDFRTDKPKTNVVANVVNPFRGTGIYAPRRGGMAPRLPRGVSAETNGMSFRDAIGDRTNNDITLPSAKRPSVEEFGDQILGMFNETGNSNQPMGGGAPSNPYTNAIRILQQQLGGGQYGSSYDNLSTLLGTTSGTASGQIDQATANAIAQINSRDPLATPINYSAGTTQIPQTALNNYLNAIGASTGTVDAGRNFLQGLIDTSASSASQAQASQQQAYAAQRQAAIDALTGNQQLQQSNLASSTQAQQMAIARAKEMERKALEDQILQYVLKGGRA